MTDRRTAAIALGLFSAAFVAGGILLGDASGMLGDSDATFIEHHASASRRAGDIAGGAAMILAGGAFLVFVAALRLAFDRGGLAISISTQAGTAFSILLIVAAGMFMTTPLSMSFGSLFSDTDQFAGGHAAVLTQAATVMVLTAAYPVAALAVGALALASRDAGVLPTWQVRLALVCAAVMPLAFFFFPIPALPIWSSCTAIALWRRAP